MAVVHFGTDSEFVRLTLPSSLAQKGWAQVAVEISVHCFRGSIEPFFDMVDFERFYKGLASLYEKLEGQAELAPLDRQFVLSVVGSGGGHISLTGEAWSRATYENKLSFTIELDQTFLKEPLVQLGAIQSMDIFGG